MKAKQTALLFVLSSLLAAAVVSLAGLQVCDAQSGASPVGIPLFHFRNGTTHMAGKAFAIKWLRGQNLLLCPLHLLGPAGGLGFYVEPQTVADVIASVDVTDLQGQSVLTTATRALLRRGAPVERRTGNLADDLMAFELPANTTFPVLTLCGQMPAVGTRVWVLTKTNESRTLEADRYAGTVTRAVTTGLDVKLDEPLLAAASSGAPVVNAQNELVGMLVGTGDAARTVINAIPSTSISGRLTKEVGR